MRELFDAIPVRKIIALLITLVYCGLSVYGMIKGLEISAAFLGVACTVIGYYFGKSTALDQPKKEV